MIGPENSANREAMNRSGRELFLDILSVYPEVQSLPHEVIVRPGDDFTDYVARSTEAQSGMLPGVYMIDPRIGKIYIPDSTTTPGDFTKILPVEEVDSRGVESQNGFFAHKFTNPDGARAELAFRPFSPIANTSVIEDFARNNIVRHLGLENTQTIGFYLDAKSGGGTISLLDREIRSLDEFKTEKLVDDRSSESVLSSIAKEIAYAHRLGISHGDLALRNAVLTEKGQVFLIDWGRSSKIRNSNADGSVITGTPEHDLAAMINDFVWVRATSDGRTRDRHQYRDIFMRLFAEPYLTWRSHYNSTLEKSEGRLSEVALRKELERLEETMRKY